MITFIETDAHFHQGFWPHSAVALCVALAHNSLSYNILYFDPSLDTLGAATGDIYPMNDTGTLQVSHVNITLCCGMLWFKLQDSELDSQHFCIRFLNVSSLTQLSCRRQLRSRTETEFPPAASDHRPQTCLLLCLGQRKRSVLMTSSFMVLAAAERWYIRNTALEKVHLCFV